MTTTQKISLSLIDPSPTQPRTDFGDISELASRLAAIGQLRPVLLRPKKGNRYECVDGARRILAAKSLSWTEVEADVQDMSDAEVSRAQLALGDPSSVKPLNAVEQGLAYADAMRKYRMSYAQAASWLGVTVEHVQTRSRLAHLTDSVRALLAAGRIKIGGAQLIASQLDEVQDEVAEELARLYPAVRADGSSGPITQAQVEQALDRFTRRLADAPFDRERDDLTARGACSRCPDNTAAQRGLYDEPPASALCLSAQCWSEKVDVAWSDRVAQAEKVHLPVLAEHEALMVLDGSRVRPGARWVDVAEPISHETPMTWRELERELGESSVDGQGYDMARCALARSGDRFVMLLDAEYAAGYIAQSYPDRARELRGEPPPGVLADKEERKREKERKAADAELHAAAVAALMEGLAERDEERFEKTLKHLVVIAADIAGASVASAVVKRRGYPTEEPNGADVSPREAIVRAASEMDRGKLTALLIEVLVFAALTDARLPDAQVSGILATYEINLSKLRKELARAKRNVKTRAKKGGEDESAETS